MSCGEGCVHVALSFGTCGMSVFTLSNCNFWLMNLAVLHKTVLELYVDSWERKIIFQQVSIKRGVVKTKKNDQRSKIVND